MKFLYKNPSSIKLLYLVISMFALSSCTRNIQSRILNVSNNGLTYDSQQLCTQCLYTILVQDKLKNGYDVQIKIVAESNAYISSTLHDVGKASFFRVSFSVDGEANSIRFWQKPNHIDQFGHTDISALVTPTGHNNIDSHRNI